jgi:selT/selW/selH-like putative selenoprotein
LKKAILNSLPNATVNILKVGGQKMGSFEVTCGGYLLFSKLALAYFPHTALLTNRIVQFKDDADHGRDLRIYKGGLSPIKINPTMKHSSSQSP